MMKKVQTLTQQNNLSFQETKIKCTCPYCHTEDELDAIYGGGNRTEYLSVQDDEGPMPTYYHDNNDRNFKHGKGLWRCRNCLFLFEVDVSATYETTLYYQENKVGLLPEIQSLIADFIKRYPKATNMYNRHNITFAFRDKISIPQLEYGIAMLNGHITGDYPQGTWKLDYYICPGDTVPETYAEDMERFAAQRDLFIALKGVMEADNEAD